MKLLNSLLLFVESFRSRIRINPYLFAIVVLAGSLFFQSLLNRYVKQDTYLLVVISIFFAAWYGGFFPCLLATILGLLMTDYYFIPPVHTFFQFYSKYTEAAILLVQGIVFGLAGESRLRWERERNESYNSEQKARREAEEASYLRDNFISMASHELKSPITSQKLYVDALIKRVRETNDRESERYVRRINNQTNKMLMLINDLLNIAKIRAGKFVMNFSQFNLNECVKETVEEIQLTDPTHNIIIRGKSTKHIYADKERIAEVITNLLSNAMKYSPNEKKIIVYLSEDTNFVTVSIRDYGIGISKKNQKKLFTQYFRAEGANEKMYKGFGMGLFIVSEIVKQHKGKLWVQSKENQGSTFSFQLPVVK